MVLLTIREVAQITKLSATTIRRRIASGELKAVRVGRGVRVPKETLDELMKRLEPRVNNLKPVLKGQPLTFDDPLWNIVGTATSAEPSDSSKKHEYLAGGRASRKKG